MKKPSVPLTFFDTHIGASAFARIEQVLREERLSEGALVKEFEEALAKTLNLSRPVGVNSGTSALHLALAVANVGPGDEVILPAQTFIASGTAILQQGAVPVFADIQLETGNIDPASVKTKITPRTKAIMPVHWGGLPVDLDEIHALARAHNLTVIEDAAHALGATYKQKPIGTISPFTCFSFQAIKHLTTGDGGALCLLDSEQEREARARRWFGIDRASAMPSPLGERIYDAAKLGFKYHLNDYAAALGLANLETFPDRLATRRKIAGLYRERLANVPGVTLFTSPQDRESAYWLFGIRVEKRDTFINAMHAAEIPVSVVHQGIDRNTIMGGMRKELLNQRRFDAEQIHLPLHDRIDTEAVEYITDIIKKGW